jgi:hypothetical protein
MFQALKAGGDAHEQFLYLTFESKTGGIFETKIKPAHGILNSKQASIDPSDIVYKKQDIKLIDKLVREYFTVPLDETQPVTATNC